MTQCSLRSTLIWFLFPHFLLIGAVTSAAYSKPTEPNLLAYLRLDKAQKGEPVLPFGLDGLKEETFIIEPMLPEGLGKEDEVLGKAIARDKFSAFRLPFSLNGFWEARVGVRTQKDPYEKSMSLGETRLQLELDKRWQRASFKITSDFLYDSILNKHGVYIEDGQGWLDLREVNFSITPTGFMDVKVGRQILTWGTGDLLFINDIFPKDWSSFFIGRDLEYLKAPSDAIKVSLFSKMANLDIIYLPRFDADRFIDGRRLSYWNALRNSLAGRNFLVYTRKSDRWFGDDEIAWRLFKNIKGYELALYGYRGFWKSPAGVSPISFMATFPKLAVYGASIRGTVLRGIGNVEVGYYNSEDDRVGLDPFLQNSQLRALVGYEQDVARNFTVGMQYYLEHTMDFKNYLRSLSLDANKADEDRHVITLRLTKLLLYQNLTLSLFAYYSPSDQDAHLRPNIHYNIDDHWAVELGGNIFFGRDDYTFFAQSANNSNMYVSARYSF